MLRSVFKQQKNVAQLCNLTLARSCKKKMTMNSEEQLFKFETYLILF